MGEKDYLEEFKEYYNTYSDNLEYAKEANSFGERLLDQEWGGAVDMLLDNIDSDYIADETDIKELSLDNIQTTIGMANAYCTEMLSGEAFDREVQRLKDFFRNEWDKVEYIYANLKAFLLPDVELGNIEELEDISVDEDDEPFVASVIGDETRGGATTIHIHKNGRWNYKFRFFFNIDSIKDDIENANQLDKRLNDYMNNIVPQVGQNLDSIYNDLLSDLNNITPEGELSEHIDSLKDYRSQLTQQKNQLDFENNVTSFFKSINILADFYTEIDEHDFNTPDSPEWEGLSDSFREVGSNVMKTFKAYLFVVDGTEKVLDRLNQAQQRIFKDWKRTLEDVVDVEDFDPAQEIKIALDDVIDELVDEGKINLSYPPYNPKRITDDLYKIWKRKSNITKNNHIFWINEIDRVINEIDNVTNSDLGEHAKGVGNMFSTITNHVIDLYEELSTPLWEQYEGYTSEFDFYIRRLQSLEEITPELINTFIDTWRNLVSVLESLWKVFKTIGSSIRNLDPRELLNLGHQSKAVFSTVISCCDALGFDDVSDLVAKGNSMDVWDIDEDEVQEGLDHFDDFKEATIMTDEITEDAKREWNKFKETMSRVNKHFIVNETKQEELERRSPELKEEEMKLEQAKEDIDYLENILEGSGMSGS